MSSLHYKVLKNPFLHLVKCFPLAPLQTTCLSISWYQQFMDTTSATKLSTQIAYLTEVKFCYKILLLLAFRGALWDHPTQSQEKGNWSASNFSCPQNIKRIFLKRSKSILSVKLGKNLFQRSKETSKGNEQCLPENSVSIFLDTIFYMRLRSYTKSL